MVRQNLKKIKKITKNHVLKNAPLDKFLKRKLQSFDKAFHKVSQPILENLADWLISLKNREEEPVAVSVKKLKKL